MNGGDSIQPPYGIQAGYAHQGALPLPHGGQDHQLGGHEFSDPFPGIGVAGQYGAVVVEDEKLGVIGQLRGKVKLPEPCQVESGKYGGLDGVRAVKDGIDEVYHRGTGCSLDLVAADGETARSESTPHVGMVGKIHGQARLETAADYVALGIDDSEIHVVRVLSQKMGEKVGADGGTSLPHLGQFGKPYKELAGALDHLGNITGGKPGDAKRVGLYLGLLDFEIFHGGIISHAKGRKRCDEYQAYQATAQVEGQKITQESLYHLDGNFIRITLHSPHLGCLPAAVPFRTEKKRQG